LPKSAIVVKAGSFLVGFRSSLVEIREPGGQRRGRMSSGFHLPQGDSDAGAAMAGLRHRRRRLSRIDHVDDAPLDRQAFGISERFNRQLK
jgi:hypothetical protein